MLHLNSSKMAYKGVKIPKKDSISTELRKKIGITQAQLASILEVSRSYLAHFESGNRSLSTPSLLMMADMTLHFHELETGKQVFTRSPEIKQFLDSEYKKVLPAMATLERECRLKIKKLEKELALMKERARNAEHAIIVLNTAIHKLNGENPGRKTEWHLKGLAQFKQQVYDNLLTCWEPEQAKLHGKIEAIAGEAKALRRYRTKVMKEQGLRVGA